MKVPLLLKLGVPFLSLVLLTSGCTSSLVNSLLPEKDSLVVNGLVDAYRNLSKEPYNESTKDKTGYVCNVVVHEWGNREHERAIVFVHGVLADHETWRLLAGALCNSNALFLVDLPGCGKSDAPYPEDAPEDFYTPESLADRVLQAISKRTESLPDEMSITLIGHSLGGTVVLRMLFEENKSNYGRFLERVDRVVLIAPYDVNVAKPDPDFKEIAETPGMLFTVADAFGELSRRVAESIINACHDGHKGLLEDYRKTMEIFRDMPRRRAAQAMMKQITKWTDEERTNWIHVERIKAQYRSLKKPCLILWGDEDETLDESMGHKLRNYLGNAVLRIFQNTRHSPQITRPEYCANVIQEFLRPERMQPQVDTFPIPSVP